MKTYAPVRRRRTRHSRVPAFVPVPLRSRADGWTPRRQAVFLAALAATRSVLAAARKAGMARETAYRLRRKPGAGSFAAAWDRVLGRESVRRKVTAEERVVRAMDGLIKPVTYRGELVGIVRKADNSALLGQLARLDRAEAWARTGSGRSQGFGCDSVCRGWG